MSKPATKKRKPKRDPSAALIEEIFSAQMRALGHGGLTWGGIRIGMRPSALLKRQRAAAGMFDAPSLKAAMHVLQTKADKVTGTLISESTVGRVTVRIYEQPSGEQIPAWSIDTE